MVDFYRKGANSFSEQYLDGKAARVWEKYIGGTQRRTELYRHWVVDLLRSNGCQHVLDAACGTGSVCFDHVAKTFDTLDHGVLFTSKSMGHAPIVHPRIYGNFFGPVFPLFWL